MHQQETSIFIYIRPYKYEGCKWKAGTDSKQTHTEGSAMSPQMQTQCMMCMVHYTCFVVFACSQECAGEEDVQAVGWRSVSVASQTGQRGGTQERYKMAASSSSACCFFLFCLLLTDAIISAGRRPEKNVSIWFGMRESDESLISEWIIMNTRLWIRLCPLFRIHYQFILQKQKTLSAYSLSAVRISCLSLFQTILN